MANNFSFGLDGVNTVLDNIAKYGERVKVLAEAEIGAIADEIITDFVSSAPVDLGNLKNSGRVARNGLSATASVTANYAAYVEFGTGTMVDIPTGPGLEGLEEYATQFKGEGKRQVNLPPRPYFFPAVQRRGMELLPRLKDILQEAAK